LPKIGIIPFIFAFILPGFDNRFGWSEVSLSMTIAGFAMVLLGYLMTLHVFITNSYASRVVDVEKIRRLFPPGHTH